MIDVVDDGDGMDELTRQRIFQPFFSTKGFEAGRGLGLSASYAIARAHRGDIRVKRSAPGAGTTMELRLPVIEGEQPSRPVAESGGARVSTWACSASR